jgi:hypothetical protein
MVLYRLEGNAAFAGRLAVYRQSKTTGNLLNGKDDFLRRRC